MHVTGKLKGGIFLFNLPRGNKRKFLWTANCRKAFLEESFSNACSHLLAKRVRNLEQLLHHFTHFETIPSATKTLLSAKVQRNKRIKYVGENFTHWWGC